MVIGRGVQADEGLAGFGHGCVLRVLLLICIVVDNFYLSICGCLNLCHYLWRPVLKDSKDDLVLDVAVESQSEYIITFNKRDFVGADKFGIKVATPQEFMNRKRLVK